MAIVSDVEIRLRADIARLQADMTQARRTVETATSGMSQAVERFKSLLGGLAVGAIFAKLGSDIIETQREFDKLNSSLITATGSAKGADKAFAALQNFAATTPFDLKQVTEGFLKLRNLGLDPSERALKSYGNTAGAMGKNLNQMIEAVADAATGEFERLKEFGIRADKNGDKVSLTFQGVTTNIANNTKAIQGYLLKLGEVNFAGGMDLQAKTLDGAISNLGDTWQALLRTLSQSGFGEVAHTGVLRLTDVLASLAAQIKDGGPVPEGLKLVAKLTAAYLAVFVGAPALITATSAALGTMALNLSLIKLEMRAGMGLWGLFNAALVGTSVSAQLAAGSLSKLQVAGALVFAAFAGWQIGKYLDENFVQARIAGEVFAGAILTGWENIKYGAQIAWAAIKFGFNTAIGGMKTAFATFLEGTAKGMSLIGASGAAAGIAAYAAELRLAAGAQGSFDRETSVMRAGHEKTIELINKETDARVAAAVIAANVSEADRQQTGNALQGIDAKSNKLTDAQKKALEDAKTWLKQIKENGAENIAVLTAELNATKPLTDAQKETAKVMVELARHKKNLSAADQQVVKDLRAQQERLAFLTAAREADKKAQEDAEAASAKDTEAAFDKVRALQEQIKTYGLTEEAVLRLQAVEYQRQLDAAELSELDQQRLSGLLAATEEQIKLQQKLGTMKATTGFWTGMESAAHDMFMSIDKGNTNLWQRMKDSAKNMFFEWLYQMTLKKWVIQIGTTISGTAGVSGIANAATNAGASSLTSVAGIYSAAKAAYAAIGTGFAGIGTAVADGVQSVLYATGQSATILTNSALATAAGTVASYLAGAGVGKLIGSAISGQYGIGDHGSAVANASTIAGAFLGGPIGGAIGGAIGGLLNRAFGMGSKNVNNTSLSGTLSPGGANVSTQQAWTQSGGWFRSDKSGTDTTALSATQNAAFASTYKAILDVSKVLGDTIGADTSALSTRVQQLKIDLTGITTEADQMAAIAKFFAGVGDAVASELVPNLASFQTEGEALSATLQRIVGDYALLDTALAAIGTTFGAVGLSSIAARENLIKAAGGMDALAKGLTYFQQNFLSASEQLAPVQKQVAEALVKMGMSSVTTVEQFKAATLAIDKTTDSGAALFAGMLALAPAFKEVADAAATAAKAAADEAAAKAQAAADIAAAQVKAAQELAAALAATNKGYQDQIDQILAARQGDAAVRALEIKGMDASTIALYDRLHALQAETAAAEAAAEAAAKQKEERDAALRANVGAALGAVKEAIASRKTEIKSAFDDLLAGFTSSIDAWSTKLTGLRSLSSLLSGAKISNGPTEASRAAAQAQIETALAIAKSSGVLPSADSLRDAIGSVTADNSAQFSTMLEYQREQQRTARSLAGLSGLTEDQISTAEATLLVIQGQKAEASAAYTRQISALDALVETGQRAADIALGTYTATVGVGQGVAMLNAALQAMKFNAMLTSAADSGRASTPAPAQTVDGLQATIDQLTAQMASMQTSMARTANSTAQLASQFDNVTAGGNAMATETL